MTTPDDSLLAACADALVNLRYASGHEEPHDCDYERAITVLRVARPIILEEAAKLCDQAALRWEDRVADVGHIAMAATSSLTMTAKNIRALANAKPQGDG